MTRPVARRLLYSVELGFYIFSIPYLLFFESKRKDFLVMLLHHACTSLLILLSFALNFMRVGLAIMFLHDVCDIFLETAKVWNYTTKARGGQAGGSGWGYDACRRHNTSLLPARSTPGGRTLRRGSCSASSPSCGCSCAASTSPSGASGACCSR